MPRLFFYIVALAALSAPALADTRPVISAPQPTSLAGKFIASGGTIAKNPNNNGQLIANPPSPPPCSIPSRRGC